jgi:hypothetical protein
VVGVYKPFTCGASTTAIIGTHRKADLPGGAELRKGSPPASRESLFFIQISPGHQICGNTYTCRYTEDQGVLPTSANRRYRLRKSWCYF